MAKKEIKKPRTLFEAVNVPAEFRLQSRNILYSNCI